MHAAIVRALVVVLFASASVVGCYEEPDDDDAVVISSLALPTDLVLNLNCADVGVYLETCVLNDPENPFRTTVIIEFNEDDPDSFNKFELADGIPPGPTGAKARFYFYATALARLPIGENQYYAALALHELYTAQVQTFGVGDPIVRDQALAAYRSVLDNYFMGAAFFACDFRNGVFLGCPSPNFDPATDDRSLISFQLNLEVAAILYDSPSVGPPAFYPNGFAYLVDEQPQDVFILGLLAEEWGYTYLPNIPSITRNGG